MDKQQRKVALCVLLKDTPGHFTVQGLATQLGTTTRTIQRDLSDLQLKGAAVAREGNRLYLTALPAELLDPAPLATDGEVRLVALLKQVYEEPGAFEPGVLAKVGAKLFEMAERTISRDLEELEARGLVALRDGRYYPGSTLLPKLSLTSEQVLTLLSYLEVQRALLPRQRVLAAAEEKLRFSLFGEAARVAAGRDKSESKTRLVKGRYYVQPAEVEARVDLLDGASREGRRVRFHYTASDGTASERVVEPLGLVYYWFHDAWYLVARDTGIRHFRLDRMSQVEVTCEACNSTEDFDLHAHLAPCWGVEHGEVQRVAIRFYDEYNVIARVRRETSHRLDARLERAADGTYLYTDEVAGLHELRVWVRSFGSSAEVVAPAQLREELIESARRIVRRYSEATACQSGPPSVIPDASGDWGVA